MSHRILCIDMIFNWFDSMKYILIRNSCFFQNFYSELIYFHCWAPSFSKLTVSFGHLENELGFYIWQLIFKISTCNGQFSERRTSKLEKINVQTKSVLSYSWTYSLYMQSFNDHYIYLVYWPDPRYRPELRLPLWEPIWRWLKMARNSLNYLILLKII